MNKLQNASCNNCFNRKLCPYNYGKGVCSFYRSDSSVVDAMDDNFGAVLNCEVRYAIGRQSYMPRLVQDFIRPLLPELSNKTLSVMQRDIETANGLSHMPECKPWGDEQIDKPGWMKFLADIEAELERRKE